MVNSQVSWRVSIDIDQSIALIFVCGDECSVVTSELLEDLNKAIDDIESESSLSALFFVSETFFFDELARNPICLKLSLRIECLALPAFVLLTSDKRSRTRLNDLVRLNHALVSEECKAFMHLYFSQRSTSQGLTSGPSSTLKVQKAAVIGSGTMGAGIAMCFANSGISVDMIDSSQEALDRGIEKINAYYDRSVEIGRITQSERNDACQLIHGGLSIEAVTDADFVIEAVFEDIELKKTVFRSVDKSAKDGVIIATNTSTFDINKIASVTGRPQNVIGLHFFSPANIMPLVEVVGTDYTSQKVIADTMAMAKCIGKTPVLSKTCYGFIGNRMMEAYAREAEFMALEGATPKKIDNALTSFGMAMGILSVFDMAGIDVGVKAHRANLDKLPPDPSYYQASQALFDAGRLGQKTGRGFYKYKKGCRRPYDDGLALSIIRARAESLGIVNRLDHTEQEIIERCIYALLNEAIMILDEGVAQRASDVDVVWTLGYGFPRERGGPLFYADSLGLKNLYEGMLKYRNKYGGLYWQPAPLLERLVENDMTITEWESRRSAF